MIKLINDLWKLITQNTKQKKNYNNKSHRVLPTMTTMNHTQLANKHTHTHTHMMFKYLLLSLLLLLHSILSMPQNKASSSLSCHNAIINTPLLLFIQITHRHRNTPHCRSFGRSVCRRHHRHHMVVVLLFIFFPMSNF